MVEKLWRVGNLNKEQAFAKKAFISSFSRTLTADQKDLESLLARAIYSTGIP